MNDRVFARLNKMGDVRARDAGDAGGALSTARYSAGSSKGTGQTSRRRQDAQGRASHSALNCSRTDSIRDDESVHTPSSKLRLPSAFAPRPAPVRLALPRYICLQSMMTV